MLQLGCGILLAVRTQLSGAVCDHDHHKSINEMTTVKNKVDEIAEQCDDSYV